MSDNALNALLAVLVGGVVSVLTFVPYVAWSYRRHGSFSARRALLTAAMAVYSTALWTYTLLPLPDSGEYVCAGRQTDPLRFIDDVARFPHASVSELISNTAAQQVVFNVLLFVPLGVFVRLLARRGFVIATALGFAVSLLIETTQTTGIWGVYPCAYRLFDVDDLIANTSGAFVGSVLAIALTWLVPAERLAARTPRPITRARRLLGMVVDVVILHLGNLVVGVLANLTILLLHDRATMLAANETVSLVALAVPLAVQLLWVLACGSPIGERVVLIRAEGPVLTRPLRWLFGIGGYGLLSLLPHAGVTSAALVLLSLLVVLAAPDRRGLAALLSGTRIADSRSLR